ncbi:hypothetical protein K60_039150 [Mycobacterium tuberculosis variant bovis BCG str. Korea 1168P]|uniref:Uncharacterized protein n=2 Tax=Mycobacterium bovis TaxID=1765 RepID=A0A1R3Y571_MYCBO|nr:Hypothetical protein BCGMEX_3836c [Mycobacterium tuberculosis variant bovis BCG str. Mexico]AGE69825.1 hypothetical protein K60_039150 [Mycobacterium tuberculosis variant bovis BCG str. Korea 1168P]AKR03709.1 hypothetical protein Mb1595_p4186 [Mycobacterium tuberculosis variant bovis]ALA80444.1 TIGR03083 domain-containing uncharacterized protein [Mycobacterium tuberculosis variant bovis BCG]AMO12051.1 hypothetical protein AZH48_19650 [Mycobacterium tuberculosis variant bovis BCG str. Tokyo 1
MPPESRPGPDSPPTDELACAEAALQVLQQVLHTIGRQDKAKQTPCPGYDVKKTNRAFAQLNHGPRRHGRRGILTACGH